MHSIDEKSLACSRLGFVRNVHKVEIGGYVA